MSPSTTLDKPAPAPAPAAVYPYSLAAERYKRPRGLRRQHFAAASVIPGAMLLMFVVAIKIPEGSISLAVTGILGLVLTAMLSGIAYAIVDTAPRVIQTRVTAAIAVTVNVTYLALVGAFALQ